MDVKGFLNLIIRKTNDDLPQIKQNYFPIPKRNNFVLFFKIIDLLSE